MTDHIEEFFAQLQAEPHPVLHSVKASLRVDLTDRGTTSHWYLDINCGKIDVSQRTEDADAVIRGERELFEQIVEGKANAFASALRGRVRFEGDPNLLVALQSVLPGPPDRNQSKLTAKEAA